MGLIEDKYGIKFIDPTILTLNINPNTGARLKPFSCIDISKTIKNDPLYIKNAMNFTNSKKLFSANAIYTNSLTVRGENCMKNFIKTSLLRIM